MQIMVLIAIAVIVLYTGAMIYRSREIPASISATVFQLSRKGQWVFTIVMWLVGFLLLPVLLEKVSEKTQFLAFLMVAGIGFVGAAPLVLKEKNTVHYVSAAIAGISSQLLVALNQPLLLLTWVLYVGYTLVAKDVSRNLFWVEFLCMLNIFALCLIS